MTRFLLDAGGEEEIEIPPDATIIRDYHGPFLPRYWLSFRDEEQLKKSVIYRKNYKGAMIFSVKIHQIVKSDGSSHARTGELWLIGINNASAARKWYYIDSGKTFPAVVGVLGWTTDKNGWKALLELTTLPVPAEWKGGWA